MTAWEGIRVPLNYSGNAFRDGYFCPLAEGPDEVPAECPSESPDEVPGDRPTDRPIDRPADCPPAATDPAVLGAALLAGLLPAGDNAPPDRRFLLALICRFLADFA